MRLLSMFYHDRVIYCGFARATIPAEGMIPHRQIQPQGKIKLPPIIGYASHRLGTIKYGSIKMMTIHGQRVDLSVMWPAVTEK